MMMIGNRLMTQRVSRPFVWLSSRSITNSKRIYHVPVNSAWCFSPCYSSSSSSSSLVVVVEGVDDGRWWKGSRTRRQFVTVDVTSTTAGTLKTTTTSSSGNNERRMNHQELEEHIVKLNGQIRIQYKHADYEGALETSKIVLEECQNYFPSDEHPAIASAHVNIGLMNKHLGQYDEARKHYTQALNTYEHLVGTDHASYAATLHNMGTLDRAQALFFQEDDDEDDDDDNHFDTRMKLNQSAIQHFEQALKIRSVELGEHHAYTITTRSSLGAALASQVLAEFISNHNNKDKTMKSMTEERWQVAQDHLEQALTSAIQNPRGPQIQQQHPSSSLAPTNMDKTTTKRRDRSKSKKERRQLTKQHKKEKQQLQQPSSSTRSSKITTLAAAGAAQNLAIFYKSRADHIESQNYDLYAQALELYKAALNVRMQLLPVPETHPSVLETKFSLAECYDAMGNESDAQILREQILNAYPIEEKKDDEKEDQVTTPSTP